MTSAAHKARNRARDAALKDKLFGGPTTDTDPTEVLLKEIQRTAGHIEWLASMIQESDPEMFVKTLWLTRRQSGFVREGEIDTTDFSHAGAMWVEIYQTERRHLANICRTALAAGIEERRVRLAEKQAELIGEMLRSVMFELSDHLGIVIDPEDEGVRTIIYNQLMRLSGLVAEQTARPQKSTLAIEPGAGWD